MPDIRCYLVIDGGAPRTPAQWQVLIQGVKDKPLAAGIIAAARVRNFPHNEVNINRPSVPDANGRFQWRLGDFEIDQSQVGVLLVLLNSRAAVYAISGQTQKETFRQVLLAELREAATDAGYGMLAPLLGLEIIGFGARETAIAQAQAWLAAHSAEWYWEEETT